jgi:DNA primase catalytic core
MIGWQPPPTHTKSLMRFTPQFLDELRARLPVSEVVGRRVKLKRAGREWKGLSPFQQEKSPSFTVNDQKGFYHDFSSGKHGDIISFLMETEGVGFAEAVERLAQMAGVPRNSSPTPWPRARAPRRAAVSAAARVRRPARCSSASAMRRANVLR